MAKKESLKSFTTRCKHGLKQYDIIPKETAELFGHSLALHKDPTQTGILWEYTHIATGARVCSGDTMKKCKEKLADIAATMKPESMEQAVKEAERRHAASDDVAMEYTGTTYCDRCVPETFASKTSGVKEAPSDW